MKYKVALIGAGNVAWHLGTELEKKGIAVSEVFSRSLSNAKKLAKRLYDAQAVNSLDFRESEAELFLLCVPDRAIPEVANRLLAPKNAYVAHTSGAVPILALQAFMPKAGVFYPLQTFSKEKKVSFKDISIFIESQSQHLLDMLAEIGYALSNKVYNLSSEERKALHVAAVFSCNFTNALLRVGEEILQKHGMELSFIKPLVEETIDKAFVMGPSKAQTGPAARGDFDTLHAHLDYLEESPEYKAVYAQMTKLIQESTNPATD